MLNNSESFFTLFIFMCDCPLFELTASARKHSCRLVEGYLSDLSHIYIYIRVILSFSFSVQSPACNNTFWNLLLLLLLCAGLVLTVWMALVVNQNFFSSAPQMWVTLSFLFTNECNANQSLVAYGRHSVSPTSCALSFCRRQWGELLQQWDEARCELYIIAAVLWIPNGSLSAVQAH